ncbi:hypothetical protein YQE_04093, partial [Dendroctonus ponderosae]
MADDKGFVSFTCQRCSQNLKLDESLHTFSEHISAELNLPIHSSIDIDLESQVTSFDHFISACRLSDSHNATSSGFMLVSDEKEVNLLSNEFRTKAALFDHLSGTSEIDHPLCEECSDYLIEILEEQLAQTIQDHDDYQKYYSVYAEETEPKLAELEKELADLSEEEGRLMEELQALRQEEEVTLKAIAEQEQRSKQITQEEERYFREYARFKRQWLIAEDEDRSLKCQLSAAQTHLEKLRNTNVFNVTFHIWHKGHFATINNFPLGTLPTAPISWPEINAAWGQTTLLFCALARKLNLVFKRYRAVPFGNHSYMEVVGENKKIPLYGSGGPKYVWDTKFDVAMVAFLDCMQQFMERVEAEKKEFKFPYRIQNGKIVGRDNIQYSIRTLITTEEQWTKALKYMLTNLKWGIAFVASQFDSDGQEIKPPTAQ